MSSNHNFYFQIPRLKAEMPALIVLGIMVFVGWAFHFGIFGWKGGFIWLGFALPIVLWIYNKRKGDYFVKVDIDGISWREHFFSSYKYIPWKYVQRIDYLVFEINFMLKETAQVVSFATSGLTDESTDELKQVISDNIAELLDENKNEF